MNIDLDLILQILERLTAAIVVGKAKEEQLLGGELLQAGQLGLNSIGRHVNLVSLESLTKATIICYILTLGVHPIKLL